MLRKLKEDVSRRAPNKALRETANNVVKEWKKVARANLQTTLSAYINSIQIDGFYKDGIVVSLRGGTPSSRSLAHAVELGLGPGGIGTQGSFDMRKFLLRGPGVKRGENGAYRDIAFSRRGRKSAVRGAPEIERVASRKVLLQARRLARGERLPAGTTDKKLRPSNAVDALQGLKKDRSQPRKTGFVLFRRISMRGGDPGSWRHPGIQARNLKSVVLAKFPSLVET